MMKDESDTECIVKRARTAAATRARLRRYDAHIKKIRPALRKSRRSGATASWQFVYDLNEYTQIPAPNGKPWTKNSFLRALRRLKALDLDIGCLPPHLARSYGTNPRHTLEQLLPRLQKRLAILKIYRECS